MNFKDYFQDERNYLTQLAELIAEENPELAAYLSGSAADPNAMSLIEYFAFLSAHLREKLDDAFPEITQNLLAKVWPVPLMPLPATSVLHFASTQPDAQITVPANTPIKNSENTPLSNPFATTQDLTILPLTRLKTQMIHSTEGTNLHITFQWHGEANNKMATIPPFSLFLGDNTQTAGLLALWLDQYLEKTSLSNADLAVHKGIRLGNHITCALSSGKNHRPLDAESAPFWRLHKVTQFYLTPQVNHFIDIDLTQDPVWVPLDDHLQFELIYQFNRPIPTDLVLTPDMFQLHCVPVVNRYPVLSQVIHFTPAQTHYTLSVPPDKHIIRVLSVHTPDMSADQHHRGRQIDYHPISAFTPTYFAQTDNRAYYEVIMTHDVTGQTQYSLKFYNHQGLPLETLQGEGFQCKILCCDTLSPQTIKTGNMTHYSEDLDSHLTLTHITQPTSSRPPLIDSHRHWDIISHFSLSPALLAQKNVIAEVLKDLHIYALHDTQDTTDLHRQIGGIVQVQTRQCDRIERGVVIRGLLLTLTLSPSAFIDDGEMYQFGRLIAHVFPYCLTNDQFLQVDVIKQGSSDVWSFPFIKGDRSTI